MKSPFAGRFSSLTPHDSVVAPPPIVNPSPDRWQTLRLQGPGGDIAPSEATHAGPRFEGIVALLLSASLHVMLLLVLALIFRANAPKSMMVMELNTIDVNDETMIFQTADFSQAVPTALKDSASEVIVYPVQVFDDVIAAELPPLDLSVPVTKIAGDRANDGKPIAAKEPDEKKEGVEFFGTHAYGSKFVYVLDVSGSMWSGQGARMRRARAELVRSINELQPHHSFYVVLYNNQTINMFGERSQPSLRPATPENKRNVARWISAVQPTGGTMPADALKVAGDLVPDAVFFLSDGEFIYSAGPAIAPHIDQILQGFGQARPGVLQGHPLGSKRAPENVLNAYAPKIVVHTIALESQGSRRMMEFIAASKGGQHRFIPAANRVDLPRRQAATR